MSVASSFQSDPPGGRLFLDRDGTTEYRWPCAVCADYSASAKPRKSYQKTGLCDKCGPRPKKIRLFRRKTKKL